MTMLLNSKARNLLILLGSVVVIASLVRIQQAGRAERGQRKILFDSDRDGKQGIYVMGPDGSNARKVTHGQANDALPAWSPDGNKIAFSSDREGHWEIYIMAADGSDPGRVTRTAGKNDYAPAWSPDGKRIAFESPDRDGHWEIYVVDADGSNVQRLTFTTDSENPDWSPDGKTIAFDSGPAKGPREIYVMDPDGSNLRQLTHTPVTLWNEHPVWSPDGKRIVFNSNWDRASTKGPEVTPTGCISDLYVMNADGSNVQRLSTTPGACNLCPVGSPDGKRIVFMSTRDSLAERWPPGARFDELYVMDSGGSNVRRLTFNKAYDAHPTW